jgi:hypothetical protein
MLRFGRAQSAEVQVPESEVGVVEIEQRDLVSADGVVWHKIAKVPDPGRLKLRHLRVSLNPEHTEVVFLLRRECNIFIGGQLRLTRFNPICADGSV